MKTILNLLPLLLISLLSYGQQVKPVETIKYDVKKSEPYLLKTYQITLSTALELTELARNKAKEMNKSVAIAILDADGQLISLSRGDEVGVHNMEAARRKAFTSASTKTSTLILGRNSRSNPDTQNLAHLPELLLLGGGVPLYHNDKVIGAIGVAGGGSPENDDIIASAVSLPKAEIKIK